ncbi:MAG: AhpC/TSA family protein [Candidatus Thiodiazotropha taylori]|nr:AhpC/TSA family protein [Candidatus Thiodiazotropha taylori]MCG8043878.1 AhpC/TSA family protein [Candidatus Thiodiazotropha taylori]MCG8081094.1 AhpC/TSA family protein [Candidatus Thiodiazotropha taylori]MCG8108374.1 AhpC/TSA family protein [Candidatus Thiodiazotropha taylori]MCG8109973.1 AhpC/TSA family protein [Candidatus Thiodiazotropha taylori]
MKLTRLKPGGRAPAFRTHDWQGNPIEPFGSHPGMTLLSFYRYASCPLCNLRIRGLITNHQQFLESGIRILAVFQSPLERIAHYVGTQSPPFPLIPDPDLKLYRLYGVESSWRGFARAWTLGIPQVYRAVVANGFLPGSMENEIHRLPADFLIDRNGRLIDVYYGRDIGDHIPLKQLFSHSLNPTLKMERISNRT